MKKGSDKGVYPKTISKYVTTALFLIECSLKDYALLQLIRQFSRITCYWARFEINGQMNSIYLYGNIV